MAIAYIAIGANLGDRAAHFQRARECIAALPATRLVAVSSVYETQPVGPVDQGPFYNAVARVRTDLEPRALLEALLTIEREEGRQRGEKWGPRTLDLDLLMFGDRVIEQPQLNVPHPRMSERAFVLRPLREIAPHLLHPRADQTIEALFDQLPAEPMRRVKMDGWPWSDPEAG